MHTTDKTGACRLWDKETSVISETEGGIHTRKLSGYALHTYWLGMTVTVNGRVNRWVADFPAEQVNGEFTKDCNKMLNMWDVGARIIWEAALWKKKVDACGCEYCRRNGYHLEGHIAQGKWVQQL